MKITFDPAKRDATMAARGLDFEDAAEVFAGVTIDIQDLRKDYGELRIISIGTLRGRMVVIVWTEPPRHFDEEGKWPREGALSGATWRGLMRT